MQIRAASASDRDAIWKLLEPTLRAGETQALPQNMARDDALAYWFALGHDVFVAEEIGTAVGSYFLRTNQAGNGDHVANCAYVVSPAATGRGIAQAMCRHSLEQARQRGYLAMQFNFVVSSNERAVRLWQYLDFEIVGRVPRAFRHPSLGFVDVFVMHRTL